MFWWLFGLLMPIGSIILFSDSFYMNFDLIPSLVLADPISVASA
jgi:hypothetical protein